MAANSAGKQCALMPIGAEKILISPHGGLTKFMTPGTMALGDGIKLVAGITLKEQGDKDFVSPNLKQQTILIATKSESRGLKYVGLKKMKINVEYTEIVVCPSTPEKSGKGVIHDFPLFYTQQYTLMRVVRDDNPEIYGVRRLVKISKVVTIIIGKEEVPR
ncbi:hypothetical protein V5799_033136 [Amblyomma americanum]|uniref:Uncharacterized protein n=1 Tax=Amblyomma americanum TaxID=6943 RepID=A0AAQ4DP65_AMBAM